MTALDTTSPVYQENRAAMEARLAELASEHAKALAGGGPKYVDRHHHRGKLLARERIELLLDRDAPFLELLRPVVLPVGQSPHLVAASQQLVVDVPH